MQILFDCQIQNFFVKKRNVVVRCWLLVVSVLREWSLGLRLQTAAANCRFSKYSVSGYKVHSPRSIVHSGFRVLGLVRYLESDIWYLISIIRHPVSGIRYLIIILITITLLSSCVPVKELRYFNDVKELGEPQSNPRVQKRIMPFDNLYVRVMSTDEKTAQIFNATEPFRNEISPTLVSYLVDEKGDISFPFAGKINVAGLTTADAGEKIQKALSEYIANTAVIVKFIDNKVTVLGEVQRQGVYTFTNDKLNIYEALAMAGGMTRYGNHKTVIIVRQVNKNVMHYKLDLSNSQASVNDLYYVNSNDVVVVEPLKHISTSYQNATYATILTSITTLVTLLYFFRPY